MRGGWRAAAVPALWSAGCGGHATAPPARTAAASATSAPAATATRLRDWPMFGLTPGRPSATNRATGITAADLADLHRRRVRVPGTVDSTPIILGATAVATTTYGKTVAVDLRTGRIRWTFTPDGYEGYAGTPQIPTASRAPAPPRRFIYAASPDGAIHKLALVDG